MILRRRGAAGLLLVALAAGCSSSLRQLADKAEAEWREGKYDEAIRLNTLLYERDSQGRYAPVALLNLGNIYYFNLRKLDSAIEDYERLAREFPATGEGVQALGQLAEIYANELHDLNQAIYCYDRLIATPELENRSAIVFSRANAYFQLNDFDRALRELRRLEEQGISGHLRDQVLVKIGQIYLIRKRPGEAVESFQKVSQATCIECRRIALLGLMESYEAQFRFADAIAAVRRLDHTPENDARVQREVTRIHTRQRLLQSAAALDLDPRPARRTRRGNVRPRDAAAINR